MSDNTLTVPVHANTRRSADTVAASPAATKAGRPPLFVPRSQLYYWTREWQEGEHQALLDLKEGRFETFSDPADAERWLLGDDAED